MNTAPIYRKSAWKPEDGHDVEKLLASLRESAPAEAIYRPEVLETIDDTIESMSTELRDLSLDLLGRQPPSGLFALRSNNPRSPGTQV